MRRLVVLGSCLVSLVAVGACSDDGGPIRDPGNLGRDSQPIIGGALDTTHDAVVALAGNNHMCTGTIIEKNAQYLYILTAGHCVAPHAPSDISYAIQGDNYDTSTTYYNVVDCMPHPSFDPAPNDPGPFDFAMCRATGVGSATPVIPAASTDGYYQTNPSPNTYPVTHVGYGVIGFDQYNQPIGTTRRYYFDGYLTHVGTTQINYNQGDGGPCSGDSGGPQLAGSPEKVVGVTSAGDEYCESYGVSGRVSAVYTSFIRAYIDNTPIGPLTCDQCWDAVTAGQGDCVWAVNACINNSECGTWIDCYNNCMTSSCRTQCTNDHYSGYEAYLAIVNCVCDDGCATECEGNNQCNFGTGGTGTGGTSTGGSGTGATGTGGTGNVGNSGTGATGNTGTGGGTTASDDWVAGTEDNRSYQGDLQSSCAASPRPDRAPRPGMLLWAGALAVGLLSRRRRSR